MSYTAKDYFSLLGNVDETRNINKEWITQTFTKRSPLSFPSEERDRSTQDVMCPCWRHLQ
uniref:Uncharacterized protein n=1 Tax=Lepeophtheirus salmonis TaxID=72036 RepID=A0A0K2UEG6_LEPSM